MSPPGRLEGESAPKRVGAKRRSTRRAHGFTLLELVIALALLGLMAAVTFGSLSLASRSLDAGEHKADTTASMRLAEEFLRGQLESQHPARLRKVADFPLLFDGREDDLRYAASLPPRVQGGGVWFYRLVVVKENDRSRLVLERVVPDLNATDVPSFDKADRSVLADDIAELRVAYFGRDVGAAEAAEPTWQERWNDHQKLPLLIRIDVKPVAGPAWPTLIVAPRQAPEAGCRAFDQVLQKCMAI